MQTNKLINNIHLLQTLIRQISEEKNHLKLLESLLEGARKIINADGGTLYTLTDDQTLKFEVMINKSLGINLGGTSRQDINFPPLDLYLADGSPNATNVACHAALTGCSINLSDVYTCQEFDFSGPKVFDEKTGYRSQSFLTIPLKDHENNLIGVIQLINAIDLVSHKVVDFTGDDQHLTEFIASLSATILNNRQLIKAQKNLFHAVVNLIAGAIDDKSPYTSKHCERVPEVTMLIAEKANQADWGIFKQFHLSEQAQEELQLAALLHDCGKLTTPVHVIDKGTKLETIFDRIEIIKLRFQSLIKDVKIKYLHDQIKLMQNNAPPQQFVALEKEKLALIADLEQHITFIKKCNVGSEFMTPEAQDYIRSIAQIQWIDEQGNIQPLLSQDEVKNLNIAKGTLTDQEREIINHHIVATITMLNHLPYPAYLKRIPEIAGGHHERVDGKGYPNNLSREQMSIQARILSIADIFEALTAPDRPYAQGKTLAQALKILGFMCQDGHIDEDIFDLFVREKIYLTYGKSFLKAEQMDEVDPQNLPGYNPNRFTDAIPGSPTPPNDEPLDPSWERAS